MALTAIVQTHSSRSTFSIGAIGPAIPTLFTGPSIPLNASMACYVSLDRQSMLVRARLLGGLVDLALGREDDVCALSEKFQCDPAACAGYDDRLLRRYVLTTLVGC